MKPCTRRTLGGLAGTLCLARLTARARSAPAAPRVVVIGGGAGGATVARYLAMSARPLDVTLVEPKRQFTTCFFSNLYLAGLRSLESLTHRYTALSESYGVRVIHEPAMAIDPIVRTVRLGDGQTVAYDRLVVAPGIGFRPGAIAGYDEAASERLPHAWMAGPQTVLLRRQLEAMPDGGVFLITAPADPFRCPPGPYERACLVAGYFRQHKPRSKILILDAKDTFFEQDLFEEAWDSHYPGMIEWLPAQFVGALEAVDPAERTVRTATQSFKPDVANIIPPQMAGALAQRSNLADRSGWCPVDPITFESTLQPGVHVVGDSVSGGDMPKSAYAANGQAKACAFAIIAELTGADRARPFLYNTCYTVLAPDDAVSDAISFQAKGGRIALSEIAISEVGESVALRARTARDADDWYDAFTQDVFGSADWHRWPVGPR